MAIDELNRIAVRRFDRVKRLLAKNSDEFLIVRYLTSLYAELDDETRKSLEELSEAEYEAYREDDDDMLEDLFLERILADPDPVTKYSYDAEVLRKRDRAIEAAIASRSTSERNAELDKALRLWSQMTNQYCDNVSDAAVIQALKNNGVKYVMWNTERDDRVCEDCKERDRKIYPITNIPFKLHWRCRCWLTRVSGK